MSRTGERRTGDRRVERRRRHQRLNISIRVEFVYEGRELFGYTRDLSTRGFFLRTSQALPEGTELDMSLHLERDADPVVVHGRVARVCTDAEAGIVFDFVDSNDAVQDTIAAYVLGRLEDKALARLDINPKNITVLLELAEIAVERGAPEDAIEYYQRVVGFEPDSRTARARLAELVFERAQEQGDKHLLMEALRHIAAAEAAGVELPDLHAACQNAIDEIRARRTAARDEERRLEREALADSQRAVAELDREKAALARQLDSAESARDRLAAKVGELEQQIEQRDGQLAGLTRERERLEEQLAQLDSALAPSVAELDTNRGALLEARAELASRAEELDATLARAETAERSLEERQHTLAEMRQQLAEMRQQLDEARQQLEEARQQLEEVRRQLEEREQEHGKQTEELEEREQELAKRTEELAKRTEELGERDKDLAATKDELAARRAELEEVRATVASRAADLVELLSRLEEAEQATHELRKLPSRVHDLEAELRQLQGERDELRHEAGVHQQQLAELRSELSRTHGALNESRKRLEALTPELEASREQIAARDTELDARRLHLAAREGELETTKRELTTRTADLVAAEEQLAARTGELAMARQELATREREDTQQQRRLTLDLDHARQQLAERDMALAAARRNLEESSRRHADRERDLSTQLSERCREVAMVESELEAVAGRAGEHPGEELMREQQADAERVLELRRREIELTNREESLTRELDRVRLLARRLEAAGELREREQRLLQTVAELTKRAAARESKALDDPSERRTLVLTAFDEIPACTGQGPTAPRRQAIAICAGPGGTHPQLTENDVISRTKATGTATAVRNCLNRARRLATAWIAAVGRTAAASTVTLRGTCGRLADHHPIATLAVAVVLAVALVVVVAVLATRDVDEPLSAEERAEIALAEELAAEAKPPRLTHSRLAISREQIVRHVRAAPMEGVNACLSAARSRGDLERGDYSFIIGWTIDRDGTVTDVEVTDYAGTELGTCMANAIRNWTFPAGAPRPSIVRDFLLGPLTVR